MMALELAADGCILPNLRTHSYRIDFVAVCAHKKIQAASVMIRSTDLASAREYAEECLSSFKGMTIEGVWQVAKS
jgi:hypothetical protein